MTTKNRASASTKFLGVRYAYVRRRDDANLADWDSARPRFRDALTQVLFVCGCAPLKPHDCAQMQRPFVANVVASKILRIGEDRDAQGLFDYGSRDESARFVGKKPVGFAIREMADRLRCRRHPVFRNGSTIEVDGE